MLSHLSMLVISWILQHPLSPPPPPQPLPPLPPPVLVPAIAKAKHDLELGFAIDGRIDEVLVAPGMRIKQGDLLIRLFTPEKEAQLRLLELRAQSTLEADAAAAELEVSKIRLARLEEALQRGGASDLELRQQLAETERSNLAVELFKQRQREAQYQFTETLERYRQYLLESPITGVVDMVDAEVGEPVQAGRPVLRLVDTSRLVIDSAVPTARSLRIQLGDPATVWPQLDDNAGSLTAYVTHIASVADPASDTRIVRVELENPGTLPGGINVLVEFGSRPADELQQNDKTRSGTRGEQKP